MIQKLYQDNICMMELFFWKFKVVIDNAEDVARTKPIYFYFAMKSKIAL